MTMKTRRQHLAAPAPVGFAHAALPRPRALREAAAVHATVRAHDRTALCGEQVERGDYVCRMPVAGDAAGALGPHTESDMDAVTCPACRDAISRGE